VGVHEANTLNAGDIRTVLLIEHVEVFFTKRDRQWLHIVRTDVNVAEHREGVAPRRTAIGRGRGEDENRGDVLPRSASGFVTMVPRQHDRPVALVHGEAEVGAL